MSSVGVRPFGRGDRDQLAALVNAHVQAVVPGASVSVNAVLSQLERQPGEFIVDPWVEERVTLVAEQRHRVAAAAHLLRYGGGEEVGESYRDAAEISWLVYWPEATYWPDSTDAAAALMVACLAQLRRWNASRWYADGALPAPGVYGVPDQWPHVRTVYEQAGFVHEGHTEVVLLATVDDLPQVSAPPLSGLTVRRAVGVNGTRLSACRADQALGYIEVETNLDHAGRLARLEGWADIGNLHVEEAFRRRGVACWLVAVAADWLRLAHIHRLLGYAWADHEGCIALLRRLGFNELTRTARGWVNRSRTTS